MKFTDSQIKAFMRLGDEFKKDDGSKVAGLLEKTLTDVDGRSAETITLTVEYGELVKGDFVVVDGEKFKVAYINDDLSGIITCYLEIAPKEKNPGGGRGKFK